LIVDTSALAAIAFAEDGWETLLKAFAEPLCIVPAFVLTELQLATSSRGPTALQAATGLIDQLIARGAEFAAFEKRHSDITAVARMRYGKGNGSGGQLNFGDLMVYAIAKDRNLPLLCNGNDFASTDIALHPASRIDK
jgi:ribonuclease VapC